MTATFTADQDFPHVCAECGWGREDHRPACPSMCICGRWSFECSCDDGEINFKPLEQSLAELRAQEEWDTQ